MIFNWLVDSITFWTILVDLLIIKRNYGRYLHCEGFCVSGFLQTVFLFPVFCNWDLRAKLWHERVLHMDSDPWRRVSERCVCTVNSFPPHFAHELYTIIRRYCEKSIFTCCYISCRWTNSSPWSKTFTAIWQVDKTALFCHII